MAQSKSKPQASTKAAIVVPAVKAPEAKISAATAQANKPAAPKAPVKSAAAKVAAPKVAAPKIAAPKLPAQELHLEPSKPAVIKQAVVPAAEPAPIAEAPKIEAAPIVKAPIVEAPIAEAQPETPVNIAPAPAAEAPPAKTSFLNLKDITMTTDFTANISETVTDAIGEVQARLQTAYDKSTGMVTEMTELAKGNVEAVVESSKLFAVGVQDLGKSYADEAKAAYETATADIKEMAAIKSPTELFQLQGKIMRRNFDMMIAATSKSTDAAMKLASHAMAPISGRVNVAAEKLSKVAA